jgi:hypothetical protein
MAAFASLTSYSLILRVSTFSLQQPGPISYAARLSASGMRGEERHCALRTGTSPLTHGPVACLSFAVMVSVVLAVASALDHA